MGFQLTELLVNGYCAVGLVAFIALIAKMSQGSKLDAFPTVGPNNWFGSWWTALRLLTNAQHVIQAGYKKHNPAPFKLPELSRWTVVLSDPKHVLELAKASDDEFSLLEAVDDYIQIRYTISHDIIDDHVYHEDLARSRLARNMDALYPHIRDEIVASFDDVLNLCGNEWKSVPALHVIEQIVCRTSSRMFVGLPSCRNPDWIDLNIRHSLDIVKGGLIAGFFPAFLRPLVIRFLTNIPRSVARGVRLLDPIIEERRKRLNEDEKNWGDKPNDLLSWLMDEAKGPQSTTEHLINMLLFYNFAAIHSASNSFTQALFYLATHPQYIQPLREEVQGIVEKDGWTKNALAKMRKLDSFLKECLRIQGMKLTSLWRKALADYTFTDGTHIPKGTLVVVATECLHHDAKFYAHPDVFEPFRFSDMGDDDGNGQKHQFVSATPEYLAFGLGKHACAGRIFAVTLLKLLLAHVVVTYDVHMEGNAGHPPNSYVSTVVLTNPDARVVFRKRAQ